MFFSSSFFLEMGVIIKESPPTKQNENKQSRTVTLPLQFSSLHTHKYNLLILSFHVKSALHPDIHCNHWVVTLTNPPVIIIYSMHCSSFFFFRHETGFQIMNLLPLSRELYCNQYNQYTTREIHRLYQQRIKHVKLRI